MPTGRVPAKLLLAIGLALGVVGDALLRAPGPPGLNMFVWVAAVAAGAGVLQRWAALAPDRGRVVWLGLAVLFASGLAWRDAPPLKLLALGCTTVALALAAYRADAGWVRREGVSRYVRAWGTGALHAWVAAALVVAEALRPAPGAVGANRWSRARGVLLGLVMAAPLVLLFGALFMSADAAFDAIVRRALRVDFERLASHLMVFFLCAWLGTGYLRGWVTGTELPPVRLLWRNGGALDPVSKRPALGIAEVATVLLALDLLFLVFLVIQFGYLFGGAALVRVTPGLTYAEYARRGFFELVVAVGLVVPVLLAADWVLVRVRRSDERVFRVLAGLQVALVLAIAASALDRLRLYRESYGLTEARFYAMVLLLWVGAMLLWLAATVLRGRREVFAFGALAAGLSTVAMLFVANPDAVIVRTNVARAASARGAARFDGSYVASLSADAVPVLVAALPSLPPAAQCQLARRLLRRWPPDRERPIRTWSWSAARAHAAVRAREEWLRTLAGSGGPCGPAD